MAIFCYQLLTIDAGPRYVLRLAPSVWRPRAHREAPSMSDELLRLSSQLSKKSEDSLGILEESLKFETIANVLGFSQTKIRCYNLLQLKSEHFSVNSIYQEYRFYSSKPKANSNTPSRVAFQVLDAPAIRNDFYTNLVSWSPSSDEVAVALESSIYIWNPNIGVRGMAAMGINDYITCVSYSPESYLLVASNFGNISIILQQKNKIKTVNIKLPRKSHGICCTWIPSGPLVPLLFYVGDSLGAIHYYEIKTVVDSERVALRRICTFKYHRQQICGISVDSKHQRLAVGGNDNCCSIWDISQRKMPKLLHLLPHQAAVKAIEFCPWSNTILATGGGTRDRCIRFWHANTGTLLTKCYTGNQITSLFWNKFKRELVVTYGFSEGAEPTDGKPVVTCFSYPSMRKVFTVTDNEDLRLPCAARSPNGDKLCAVATNQTLRFYKVGDVSKYQINQIWDCDDGNLFGSPMIADMENGISMGRIR